MAKRLLVIRLGALGDMLILTPLFKLLKQDGYHVTLLMKKYAEPCLHNCPYVDEYMWHDESIPLKDCPKRFVEIAAEGKYDKVLNLSGSLESSLLVSPDDPRFDAPKEARDTDANYYDYLLARAGYKIEHPRAVLWINEKEQGWIDAKRCKFGNQFVIYWQLAGSGTHKTWPYAEEVGKEILRDHKNVTIVTNGDELCKLLESWGHKRAIHKSGTWSFRSSILFTRVADLVISPETGIMHAAGSNCVPKIVLLTHSNHNNFSKYFTNVYPIQSEAACSPCHRLMSEQEALKVCPKNPDWGASLCSMSIRPEKVRTTVEQVLANRQN